MATAHTAATITLADLRAKGACRDQVALFEQTFGDSVVVTVAKARKFADKFDWNWAARAFLKAQAEQAYQAAMAQALQAYQAAKAPALQAYQAAKAPAFASAFIAQSKGAAS